VGGLQPVFGCLVMDGIGVDCVQQPVRANKFHQNPFLEFQFAHGFSGAPGAKWGQAAGEAGYAIYGVFVCVSPSRGSSLLLVNKERATK